MTKVPLLLCVLSSFLTEALRAGPAVEFKYSQPTLRSIPINTLRTQLDQTFQSEFKANRGRSQNERSNDNTNTWHYNVELTHRIPLNDHWYFKLGIEWNRYDFGNNRSLAPNTLSSYAAVLALEYWVDQELGFFMETKPGLYIAHRVRSDSIDAPTNIVFAYPLVNHKLYLIGGVTMALLREYPVLPIGGILWHINDQWDLRAYLPEPKLVYKPAENWEVWGGGEIYGGAFRNDDRSDERALRLNHTPVEYYELRGGGGVRYSGWKHVTLDLNAGYAFVRKFDFYRADFVQETQGAPYFRLAATLDF